MQSELTKGPVMRTMIGFAIPMILGTFYSSVTTSPTP